MKKVLLTAMALLTIAGTSLFGMYGNDKSWIDFLVHGNQFRARMNQLGFTLGNGTVKGTFGFKGDTGGLIVDSITGNNNSSANVARLAPTISMGIGYTSPAFGIGVGYNYTWKTKDFGIHTPVLAINALNDNLRIVVPVQIGVDANDKYAPGLGTDYTSVSLDPQIRIYTGIDAVSHIRLTLKYGMASYKLPILDEQVASSFGFEFRINFAKSTVGNVVVDPFFRVTYDTALEGREKFVTAGFKGAGFEDKGMKDYAKPYRVLFELPVGLNASSDIVTLYLEPRLGYQFSGLYDTKEKTPIAHQFTWGAYAEIYITPVKDLEWYFEADVGNTPNIGELNSSLGSVVNFATSTGITWYLPSFNGAE